MHVLDRPGPDPDATARYREGPSGVVELFAPSGTVRATAILLHGGFWRARYDRSHLRPLAGALAAAGVRVALPEYRRVGESGGGAPGTIDDARAILRDVPALLGAEPAGVAVVGHSAGGHLAVLAASGARPAPCRVVSLAGVLDVAAAHRAALSDGAVAALLGVADGDEPDPARIAAIDPMALAVPACEVVLLHGGRDEDVPLAQSAAYAGRSPRIRLRVLDDADHYDLVDPLSRAFPAVLAAVLGAGAP